MKRLTYDEIVQITKGAAYIEEMEGKVSFHRFTKEQEELYFQLRNPFFIAAHYSAGVKLEFQTDSTRLYLKADVWTGSDSRFFFAFDVFVNGAFLDSMDNFSERELEQNYTEDKYLTGVFEKEFYLGEGMKTVCVHLPYSMETKLCQLSVNDGSQVRTIHHEKKLVAFGDSITHGYDALHPSKRYISKLADYLEAEEFNKAIGGETFFPELAATKEEFEPDYVVVAYGTNDWSHGTREVFQKNCSAFYQNVSRNYPNARIFALSPIWRKNYLDEKEFGLFSEVEDEIRAAVEGLTNVEVIPGFDLVPHDEIYFGDLRLHPRDEGFGYYFENIKKYI